LGLARLGNLLKFIPYSLIVGFTSAIALIILSSQINDFFGLGIQSVPSDFIEKWEVIFQNFSHINRYAVAIAIGTLLLTIYFQKLVKKIPGSIIDIIVATLVVKLFEIPVDTIESKFGDIPNKLSMPTLPAIDFNTLQSLIQPAFAIALLGSIESLLSAVVSDSMIGGKHRSNMELIAQGTANIFSALLGGIPATGAIARTATNAKNGGRTPLAGVVHGIVLLAIMLLFAQYAKLIPLSCLAGILLFVAYHMSEWRQFLSMLKGNRMDIIILLTTFFLTVLFDLVIAIEIGIVLASFLFMKRMSESVHIQNISNEGLNGEQLFENEKLEIPKNVVLYEINGPLFFGAARQFQETITQMHMHLRVVIIRMRYVPLIDATGIQSLIEIIKTFKSQGIVVIISGVNSDLLKDFERYNLYEYINKEFIADDINSAIEKAKTI
jgi:SulP family sulfate permease